MQLVASTGPRPPGRAARDVAQRSNPPPPGPRPQHCASRSQRRSSHRSASSPTPARYLVMFYDRRRPPGRTMSHVWIYDRTTPPPVRSVWSARRLRRPARARRGLRPPPPEPDPFGEPRLTTGDPGRSSALLRHRPPSKCHRRLPTQSPRPPPLRGTRPWSAGDREGRAASASRRTHDVRGQSLAQFAAIS